MKVCTICKESKPDLEYYKDRGKLRPDCKSCCSIRKEKYYEKNREELRRKAQLYYRRNPEPHKIRSRSRHASNPNILREKNLKQYGLSIKEYDELSLAQQGLCAICKQEETATLKNGKKKLLAVDHDHSTGKVRGLLCVNCNRGIGSFKDNAEILKEAISYLERQQ